ncbi:PA-domain containing subtilase family protein [Actinidia rufa]|uniref:PA-domain containing subtilase family protein n=1 Tax=Actinidia rufa TaxID=165716 RepID=A0A7J0EZ47_9ERIC|nr:PA-domain containing subtilase family protein [Actinidia rufa]
MAKTRPGKRDLDSYTIRGTDKVVRAGDCVLMRPSDNNTAPYVAVVEKIEADNRNSISVRVRWYYRPEESRGGRRQFHGAKELFLSDHFDVQSAHTIEGKCIVHTFKNYTKLENVGAEDYYCRFEYKAATGAFIPDSVAVYCKCEMPYNPDDLMVQCEGCKDWYHPACVNMTIEQAKLLDQFMCSDCSSDNVKKPQTTYTTSPPTNGKKDDPAVVSMIQNSETRNFTEERDIYLVLMDGDPVAFHRGSMPEEGRKLGPNSEVSKAYARHLVDSHDQILESSLERGSYNKLYSFKHIANGFAVHTSPSQVEKIKRAPGVKLVERDRRAKLMTTYTPQFLGLPQGVWAQEGGERNAGEGIVIGFIDSGINPFHPSFAYDPMNPFASNLSRFSGACEDGPRFPVNSCNGKIVSARFFSAGAQAVATLNASVDFLSPFDAVGHGSHVASTAAGNSGVSVVVNSFYYGQASGMAPRARIAVYKAIYPSLGTLADVLAAMDQATLDGVDILTLSVGPDEPPEDTLTFLSVFDLFMLSASKAGIFVVQAAGNHGPSPYTVVSYSPWAIGVAASTTDRTYPATLILGNAQRIGGVGLSGPSFGSGLFQYKLVLAKDAVKADGSFPKTPPYTEECQFPEALDPIVVQGSVVICTFSEGFYNETSSVTAIIDTAKALGFMGFVLVANPVYGDFIAEPIPFAVPGIMIPKTSDAEIISKYYKERTCRDKRGFVTSYGGRAAIGEGRVASYMGRAPIVSRYSSRGPDFIDYDRNPTDVLKPDILAPGHQIWAAWSPISVLDPILFGNSFALLSGTSMATPHIAGIAALIKQNNPSWTPATIASAMSTTATKYDNNGEPIMAEGSELYSLYPSTPFDFGAGLVNPSHAFGSGPGYGDYINFLCSLPNTDPATIKTATGGSCNNSFINPSDLNTPSVTISALRGYQLVRRSVKNVANKPETYLCAVLPPEGVTVKLNPFWFRVAPQGSQELEIELNVTQKLDDFRFGEIVLTGSLNHIVRIPLSVFPVSMS